MRDTLIEVLEAELDKPAYEGYDYRSGLRKAISIVRQYIRESNVEAVASTLWEFTPTHCDVTWEEQLRLNPTHASIQSYRKLAQACIAAALGGTKS